MNTLLVTTAALTVSGSSAALAESAENDQIIITRNGSQASLKGPDTWFSGPVRVDMYTHPLGQTLVVTAGKGWVQEWGREKREIHPGDVVWFPPNVKHWHGASGTTALSHIAIQEAFDGKSVDWLENVSDEQYAK
jgi:mannose-6-phosphate isomerase-like protein (cupin superfamily)